MGIKKLARLGWPQPLPAEDQPERWRRTFAGMRPWLPERAGAFVDIGCGSGGIAALVAKHYGNATAHLIDSTELRPKWAGYREGGEAWDDVETAAALVRAHCPGVECRAWPPDPALTIPADLIYSICSWGHHYQIETYLALAVRSLRPGGILIVDLRNVLTEHGSAVLSESFVSIGTVPNLTPKKYVRTVWRSRA